MGERKASVHNAACACTAKIDNRMSAVKSTSLPGRTCNQKLYRKLGYAYVIYYQVDQDFCKSLKLEICK